MLFSTTKTNVLRGVMVVSAVAAAVALPPTAFEGECGTTTPCSKGEFCNFDFGSTGFCETCSGFITREQCFNEPFLNSEGNSECVKVCIEPWLAPQMAMQFGKALNRILVGTQPPTFEPTPEPTTTFSPTTFAPTTSFVETPPPTRKQTNSPTKMWTEPPTSLATNDDDDDDDDCDDDDDDEDEGEECKHSSTDCSNVEFCNFANGSTGYCKSCLGYTTEEQCNSAFLTLNGKSSCYSCNTKSF